MAAVTACRVHPGANHLLFVSKANSGLDIDSMPAEAEVSVFGHSDTVLGPTFENAQSAPVIAAFQRSNDLADGWPLAGSTVATGPAAMAVASGWVLATSPGSPAPVGSDQQKQKKKNEAMIAAGEALGATSDVHLSEVPNARERDKQMFVNGEAPPTCFSTSGGFGFEIELRGPVYPVPESVHAGYRRKESLVVPLSLSVDESNKERPVVVHTPSVLNVTRLVPVYNKRRPRGCHSHRCKRLRPCRVTHKRVQLFATGAAATRLAGRKSIHRAMLEGFVEEPDDSPTEKQRERPADTPASGGRTP